MRYIICTDNPDPSLQLWKAPQPLESPPQGLLLHQGLQDNCTTYVKLSSSRRRCNLQASPGTYGSQWAKQLGLTQVLEGVPNGRAAGEDTKSEKPLLEGRRRAGKGSTDTQSSPVLQAHGAATVWQVGAQRCQVLCAAFQMEQFLKLFFEPISHQANTENWLVELQGHVALLFQSSANKLKLQSWMP